MKHDPRYCPQCGCRGKRQYRQAKRDSRGPRFALFCPRCEEKWDMVCMFQPRMAGLPEGTANTCG